MKSITEATSPSAGISFYRVSDWQFKLDTMDFYDVSALMNHLEAVPEAEKDSASATFLRHYIDELKAGTITQPGTLH